MLKKIFDVLIDRPFLASIFISDLFILLFHKPPFLFSLVMLTALMGYCMFLGQKLSLFKD
ncbi:MAG: hypothetical protein methR_P0958 [Methyloprofundus sp.]|nr:MAG: hypothetical protein methR_P0958 [Methyloprofundus sp.]